MPALNYLCECLTAKHGVGAVVLIDEYDVPLESAWVNGFYKPMLDFFRSFLGAGLKDSPYLRFAVLTGKLQPPKFISDGSGFNNFDLKSILSKDLSEFFEPWGNPDEDEWLDVLLDRVSQNGSDTRDLETLLAGGRISKPVRRDFTYDDLDKGINDLWGFLLFSGYLKKIGDERTDSHYNLWLDLEIPNMELLDIYKNKVREWFSDKLQRANLVPLHKALFEGDAKTLENEISDFLLDTISYNDYKEDFYHGVMIGLLAGLKNYNILSNREAGTGRPDLVVKFATSRGKAVILEFKYVKEPRLLDAACDEALAQIETQKYDVPLVRDCYQEILKYGIAFCAKDCMVKRG
jgi:hypothetical protein